MLNSNQLQELFVSLGLSQEAQTIVKTIRTSPPSRLTKAGVGNVTVRYASRKMGQVIQAESHKSELAFIYRLEHDSQVLEYYDQPPAFKLTYLRADGKKRTSKYTSDFFVIRANQVGWVECKTEEQLVLLAEKDPARYSRDENGKWHCPPAKAYAAHFGLAFEVWSTSQIDWIYLNNLQFLEDFLQPDRTEVTETAKNEIFRVVQGQEGISLKDLLSRLAIASSDNVYTLIAQEQLYTDLYAVRLSDRLHVRLYLNSNAAPVLDAPTAITTVTQQIPSGIAGDYLAVGERVWWDGKPWLIVNMGTTSVSLLSKETDHPKVVELPSVTFETLREQGKLIGETKKPIALGTNTAIENSNIRGLLLQASPIDLAEANERAAIVRSFLNKELTVAELLRESKLSKRTFWRWVSNYRKAEKLYGSGNGYVGLLPHTQERGNRKRKLPQATLDLMQEFIEKEYETVKQKNIFSVWGAFVVKCEEQGLKAPTYKIFAKAVKTRPRYEQTLKRQGAKAAYKNEPFYWELEYTTPRHGDYPFQICHIDHTELDLELRHSTTNENMGRPWVTFLTDAFSRRILAFYLTYDPPSYRSCMMVLRECVQRHGRLPQTLVADGGREFHSVYFETLLARYECHLKSRPAAKPRFGSVCERLFGTTNTRFLYNLEGNTQATKEVRQLTASVNPKRLAIWTLDGFYEHLTRWAYIEYDTIRHPALGQSPHQAFTTGLIESGRRLNRLITYNEDFIFTTLPSTPKGTTQVQINRGIKINNIYYWHTTFNDPLVERSVVEVRYDPFNAGVAYAYVKGQWLECLSEYYSFFKEHTERELKLATTELRQQNKQHGRNAVVTARQLALFINSVQAGEQLAKQRRRDQEGQKVQRKANKGENPPMAITTAAQANQEEKNDSRKIVSFTANAKAEEEHTTDLAALQPQPKTRKNQSQTKTRKMSARPTKLTIYEDY